MDAATRTTGIVLLLAAAPAVPVAGTDLSWINSLGGPFQLDSNWDPLGVPGALDTAIFNLTDAYTVTFAGAAASELLNVSEGEVTLALSQATYTINGLIVGDHATDVGLLTLLDGSLQVSAISPALKLRIGKDAGADGHLVVSAGATLASNDVANVGDAGTGRLTIASGGSVTTPNVFVGDKAGSSGIVTVEGAGSSWNITGNPFIGNTGTGTLNVLQGGSVTCSGLPRVGDDPGSQGTVNVDGDGSTWTVLAEMFIGNFGSGSLNVTGGGDLLTAKVKVGDDPGSTGAVLVNGAGSTWTDSVEIIIGNSRTGSLTASGGATVSGVLGFIGDNPGSTGTAVIDGAGTAWSSTQQLHVGNLGAGTLSVRNGGNASAPIVSVGALGVLEGNGSVTGAVSSSGTVRPGLSVGTLTFNGSHAQSASARLQAELSCSGSDRLVITGSAQLGGTLDLSFVSGAAPFNGQQFTVLSAALVSGVFAAVNAPVAVQTTYLPGSVRVTVLAGPAPHPGDIDLDGTIGVSDLLALLGAWGLCPGCPADINHDGAVNVTDLLTLLGAWGPACP